MRSTLSSSTRQIGTAVRNSGSPDRPPSDPDRDLKAHIRARLPAYIFASEPRLAFLEIPYLGLLAGGSFLLCRYNPGWGASLVGAVLLSFVYSSFFFFGHMVAHGAVVRSRRLQMALLFPAFAIVGLSPHLWRVWHNRAHHSHTNITDEDPDSWGFLSVYQATPAKNFVYRLHPGSGHPLSLLYLFVFFTVHTQIILWLKIRQSSFGNLGRTRPIIETISILAFWIAVAAAAGGRAIYVVMIPMLLTNLIIMSYIATNHHLRPLSTDGGTLATTISVCTFKWLDLIHYNFSHHVEHHLFPAMNPIYAPLVRNVLQEIAPDLYVSTPHWLALWMLYRTPRLYDGDLAFADPFTRKRIPISLVQQVLHRYPASRL
jgi:fatty acid desaturase